MTPEDGHFPDRPGDAPGRPDDGDGLPLDLIHFADQKSGDEVVEAVALFRVAQTGGAASADECEWALELLERFAVRRRPPELAALVARLAVLGQVYDVQAVLETAARRAAPGDVVELRELLPDGEARRLVELFTAHRTAHDVAALLQVLAGPRRDGVQDARPWADAVAREVLGHAAASGEHSGDVRGHGVARLVVLLRHRGLDTWADRLIEDATPPNQPVEALSGLATALEAFRPGAPGLPDDVWERLDPEAFVAQLTRTWPDPGLAGARAAGRDRILGGALAREPAALQAIHGGLSAGAAHLAHRLIVNVATRKPTQFIADFAELLRREDTSARADLVREAARSRSGRELGELVQLWKGRLRGGDAAMRELLTTIAEQAPGAAVVEAVRYLADRSSEDLAADMVEHAVRRPPRLTGPELAELVLLVSRGRRRTRASRTVARSLAVAYERRAPAGAGTVDAGLLADYAQALRGRYEEGIQHLDDAVVSTGQRRLVREYATELGSRGEAEHARRTTDRIPI